ncbi:MAG: helix-hairpin-helix domain-containing protein [Planctomycetes bacterium]|nr:helix-hairpin-helix domain-containing protein [Planctomycetota bacterium]
MAKIKQDKIQLFAFVIAVLISVCLSVCFAGPKLSQLFIAADGSGCEIKLDDKLNPNYATVESLARLPGVGLARAEAIVAYRENFNGKNGDSPVFQSCYDLQKIDGLGPKITKNINRWLKFE